AIASSVALRQADAQIREMYHHFRDTPRDFIMLLHHMLENNLEVSDILSAYNELKAKGIKHPSVEQIKAKIVSLKEDMSQTESYDSEDFKRIEATSVAILQTLAAIMDKKTTVGKIGEKKEDGTIVYNRASQGATPARL
ncbi:MAG: hypothetical protein SNG34_04320, partial [Rikenellaceae bacterium]